MNKQFRYDIEVSRELMPDTKTISASHSNRFAKTQKTSKGNNMEDLDKEKKK